MRAMVRVVEALLKVGGHCVYFLTDLDKALLLILGGGMLVLSGRRPQRRSDLSVG